MNGSGTMTMMTGGVGTTNTGAGFDEWFFPDPSGRGSGSGSGVGSGVGSEASAGHVPSTSTGAAAEAGTGPGWGPEMGGSWYAAGPGSGSRSGSAEQPAAASSSATTTPAGSPLDQFSSLFDSRGGLAAATAITLDGRGSDSDALLTASASDSGSPARVKREDGAEVAAYGRQPPLLPLAELDGFADLEEAVGLVRGSSGRAAEQLPPPPPPQQHQQQQQEQQQEQHHEPHLHHQQQRKRRAPRKRLTAHQKEAHNKIEKRYRININTKIAKLQQIIPWVASEETAFEVGSNGAAKAAAAAAAAPNGSSCSSDTPYGGSDSALAGKITDVLATPKLNKSMILEKAVDYILYLQNNERLFEMEVQRLKKELERSRQRDS
ncbi:LADA_0F07954g1_1 [Lachancea dasiensis]|uniref:LADA_0F07954g1_1 n=1 Tax=Lachancea dasiensis TaxID=1072105 RepID=A0A1G4JKH6_9SACH|nr:LADA_0F07954g1_1 [Lachancea dasiensis]